MAEVIITSFFTNDGVPAVNISAGYPQIHIWDINSVVGVDTYLGSFLMTQVTDSLSDVDGFYKFIFSSSPTFVPTHTYLFRTDGGPTLSVGERYQSVKLDPSQVLDNFAGEIWNATAASFTAAGTMGLLENQNSTNTTAIANNLYLNSNSVLDLVQLLLQYSTNRTKIDPVACTMTIYENDCVTPLRVFKLLDVTGNLSISQVAERKPVSANDGLPVCP